MHRPSPVLPTSVAKSVIALVIVLVAVLASALTAGSAAAAGRRPFAESASDAAYTTTVTNFDSSGNQTVRFDTDGKAVDATEGMLALFGGTYYLYRTAL